jgi:O-antigen/teichoic acid export membrane protein
VVASQAPPMAPLINPTVLPDDPSPDEVPAGRRFSSRLAYAQTFVATVATRCLGVISGVLAARLLGPTGRGELAVVIFLPMLLVPLGEVELPRSLAYEVSHAREFPRAVIATGFWLALGLGVLQALVLAALLPIYLPADKLNLLSASRWFMVYLPATYITATLMGSDQGIGRFGRFSFLLALPGGLYTIAIVAAWAVGRNSPAAFAFGLLIATLATTAARIAMDRRSLSFALLDWDVARRLLTRGIGYYLPAIAGFVLYRADMFILVRIAPSEAIGLYAVAQAISTGQIGAVIPFVHVSFTAVAQERNRKAAFAALTHHFRLAQLAIVGAALVTAALTPWGVRALFGSGFTGAATAAYFLIGATVFWGMSQVLEQGLRAAGHPRPGIISNLAGLAVLFALGIPECRRNGISGLAAAVLAAQVLNLTILVGFCVVRLKISLRSFWALDGHALHYFREITESINRRLRWA